MLITKVKEHQKILEILKEYRPFVFKCFGCKEVYFPEDEIDDLLREGQEYIRGVARIDYLCNEDFTRRYLERFGKEVKESKAILVFSCGVGVQVVSKLIEEKIVLPGCDTFYINGFQGVTAQDFDCEQCGHCWLNLTGGICPVTACPKGLLNGPCGGAKNGKCEVNPEMDCAWIAIYKRLKETGKTDMLKKSGVNIRDYNPIVKAVVSEK
jgi:hypothetical protein